MDNKDFFLHVLIMIVLEFPKRWLLSAFARKLVIRDSNIEFWSLDATLITYYKSWTTLIIVLFGDEILFHYAKYIYKYVLQNRDKNDKYSNLKFSSTAIYQQQVSMCNMNTITCTLESKKVQLKIASIRTTRHVKRDSLSCKIFDHEYNCEYFFRWHRLIMEYMKVGVMHTCCFQDKNKRTTQRVLLINLSNHLLKQIL